MSGPLSCGRAEDGHLLATPSCHKWYHLILRRDNPFAQTVVPDHRQLDRGTLRAILRQIGMTAEELIALL